MLRPEYLRCYVQVQWNRPCKCEEVEPDVALLEREDYLILVLVLSFGLSYLLSSLPFGLFDLTFDLFLLVVRQFTYFFTNLSFDLFPFSPYFIFAHTGQKEFRT